jgi:Putative auto-transporter adhesin, head GIN domain
MRSILACILAILSVGAFAEVVTGNGRAETEQRSVPAFTSISVGGSGTLRVHRGAQKLELTCDSNILPYITTTVSGGELSIGFKPFTSINNPTKMQFDVTLPELRGVNLSGSGDAHIDAFKGAEFSAAISGSGGMKAELDYKSVSLKLSGSGGFDATVKAGRFDLACSGSGGTFIKGSADRADIALSGSAELEARGFATGDARIFASGSSRMEIRAAGSLDVALSGSGELRYWGNPSLSQRVSGSGRVYKAGD